MKNNALIGIAIIIVLAVAVLGCTSKSATDVIVSPTAAPSGVPTTQSSQASSSSLGLSRTNPAPLGSAITLKCEVSQYDNNNKKYVYLKIQERYSILDVTRGYDAVESMLSSESTSMWSLSPKEKMESARKVYVGKEPMLVKMRYELLSVDVEPVDSFSVSDYGYNLVAANGTVYPTDYFNHPSDYGLKSLSGNSYQPYTAEGYIFFWVFSDDPAPVMHYDTAGKDLWFKLK